METSTVMYSTHPILLIAFLIAVFLASLLAQWIMPMLSGNHALRPTSQTSSIVFRRYVNQPPTEDPFCALDNDLSQDHEELAAFGSWTNCEDPAPPYGLEAPNLAPYGGYYTFQSGGDH